MQDTRKLELDVALINRLLPLLEAEVATSEKEEEEARIKYEQAKNNRITALAHLHQMRGENGSHLPLVDADYPVEQSTIDERKETQLSESTKDDVHALESIYSSTNDKSSESDTPFWVNPGFQWRRFLPEFIEKQHRFMNISDVLNALKLTDQQKQKHYATVSSALSVLAKDGEKIVAHTIPGLRGQLYGLPSFFDEEKKVKHEFVDDLLKRRLG